MNERRTVGRTRLSFKPAGASTWPDVVRLFGPRGASAGCWCMFPRLPRRDYEAGKGSPNRRRLRERLQRGEAHAILAYDGGVPVAWCSFGPRATFPFLSRSRVLAPPDARPVWSVVCFFVARGWRRRGITARLLDAAADYASKRGADLLEGYPHHPRGGALPDAFVWAGTAPAFRAAGFEEVARRSPVRSVMRRRLAAPQTRGRRLRART